MKIRWFNYIMALCLFGGLGCSSDESSLPVAEEQALAFRLSTTVEGEVTKPSDRLTRLYVVERKPGYKENLYCDKIYKVENDYLKIGGLEGVWYKFAFFQVPAITPEMGANMLRKPETGEKRNEFYDWKLDYTPILHYQQNIKAHMGENLSVYRAIVDRWINADMSAQENVLLKRINGQLLLLMGKPADQFDTTNKGAVTKIELSLQTPVRCYLRDGGRGEVIPVTDPAQFAVPFTFTWQIDPAAQLVSQELPVMLLAGPLEGTVTVHFEKPDAEPEIFPLQGRVSGEHLSTPIEIKPNKRTIVLFNGIDKGDFEIRYAGFKDGNDADIDVDTDEWDGIQ